MIYYVVGSGPTGVSVSLALLKRGFKVTMLDYGNDISDQRSTDVKNLANTDKRAWTSELTNKIKYTFHKDIENKLAYGEDYPYRDSLEVLKIKLQNCKYYPSLAVGGLSNVWGGAVLPYTNKDIKDWPITIDDLVPYYKEVSSLINISTYQTIEDGDDLIKEYPIYNSIPSPHSSQNISNIHHISHQVKQFYNELKKDTRYNKKNNLNIGYARNAYAANACIDCSLCLWGCPLDLIYNSKQTLSKLKLNSSFTYVNNVLVQSFEELSNSVKILAINKHTHQEQNFIADKLFLASGVLSTAKIVLRALKNYNPVYMTDTPYFIFPLINFKLKGKYVNQKNYNTLSQLFMEINNDSISMNTVHLQVYPYNDMLLDMLENKLGKLFSVVYPVLKGILNKTVIVQGFFHSNEGNKIKIQLQQNDSLYVTGDSHYVKPQIKGVIKILKKKGIIPTYGIGPPGRSSHCGGTFPMTDKQLSSAITTNTLGLINKTKNIHIVDASILPSTPAQSITYTVMANAYRIGSQV